MSIFNSLGSNYSGDFVLRSLFGGGSSKARQQLTDALAKHYGGQVTLTYKGREALELALARCDLPAGSYIGINGFTCYVVYQAVSNVGLKPVFIDTASHELNFGLDQLTQANTKNKLSALIVQNTLGYPADMSAIQQYCREQNIIIIEDLAHSLGAWYEDGSEAGLVGSMTMLSVSQDKPLDVVAGGVLIDRKNTEPQTINDVRRVSIVQSLVNRTYPLWTAIIRGTYGIGLGKIIHFGLKKLHLIAAPMNDSLQGIHIMGNPTAKLVLGRWYKRDVELGHRRLIADIYQRGLPQSLQPFVTRGQPAYLRFALWVENRPQLIQYLKSHGIHIGDTWYDAPIGPKRYLAQTSYTKGLCPYAEALAGHIVNLPTHRHVSPKDAQRIVKLINDWPKQEPTT